MTAAARTSPRTIASSDNNPLHWTLAHTDEASKDYMRGLPFDLHFPLGDQDVHLVHGSPRKVNEYLFEDKPASLYERLARAEEGSVLVFGHTHKPWIHDYGGVLFVNCGSVGKPKDGDPRAAFAILEAEQTGLCERRSSASPTTRKPSHATSQQSGCQASTPKSSSGRHRCPTAPTNSPRLR